MLRPRPSESPIECDGGKEIDQSLSFCQYRAITLARSLSVCARIVFLPLYQRAPKELHRGVESSVGQTDRQTVTAFWHLYER